MSSIDYAKYVEAVMSCNDPRTSLLSFAEWMAAGSPSKPEIKEPGK